VQTDYFERWIFFFEGGGLFLTIARCVSHCFSKVRGVPGDECFATLAVTLVHKTNDESGFVSWRFQGLFKITLDGNNGLTI